MKQGLSNTIMYLYRISCEINGKNYIGQTKDANARWRRHKTDANSWTKGTYKRLPIRIDRKIAEYGVENFSFEVIASGRNIADANELEIALIQQYESHISTGKGYNDTWGGKNFRMAENTKRLISIANLGQHRSPDTEFKEGLVPWNKGIKGAPSWNKGITIIDWPEDEKLLTMVNEYGMTAVAKLLSCSLSSISMHLSRKGLQHSISKTNNGTFTSGINHKMAKLTEDQVLQIVRLYRTNDYTQQELADQFEITRSAIASIIKGKCWSSITGIIPANNKV